MFDNTLTYCIYIVFYTLISRAHPAHNLGNFYAMSRHTTPTATPSPRSGQLPHHGQPHPNGIRAHNLNRFREADGRTLVPGWNASRPKPFAHGPAGNPRPPGCASEYTYKFRLTASIPMGFSAVGRVASGENIQNINLL